MVSFGALSDVVDVRLKSDEVISEALDDGFIQSFILDANTQGQLFDKGVDAFDTDLREIGGDYAEFTKRIKESEGLPTDRVTLYDTGAFYRSFKFLNQDKSFEIEANTVKDGEDLQQRWGDELLGLTEESISNLSDELAEVIVENLPGEILRGVG